MGIEAVQRPGCTTIVQPAVESDAPLAAAVMGNNNLLSGHTTHIPRYAGEKREFEEMAKHTKEREDPKLAVIEMRAALARAIAAHAQLPGEHPTAITGLVLFRRTVPVPVTGPRTNQASQFSCRGESA